MSMTIHGNLSPIPSSSPNVGRATAPTAPAPPQAQATAQAPAGVTPELWHSLNAAEQAYFANSTVRGPLVYGQTSMTEAAAPRGQRIDVRA